MIGSSPIASYPIAGFLVTDQEPRLTVANLLQAQSIQNISITILAIQINNILQNQTLESITLAQIHNLLISSQDQTMQFGNVPISIESTGRMYGPALQSG